MKNDSSSCTSDLSRVSSSGSCSDHIVLPPDKNSQLKQRQFEKREYCEQRVGEDIHNPECFKISFSLFRRQTLPRLVGVLYTLGWSAGHHAAMLINHQ